MRKATWIKLAGLVAVLAIAAAVAAIALTHRSALQRPATARPDPSATQEAGPPVPIGFSTSGAVAPIVEALEHIVRKGRAAAAVWPRKAPRWYCVLIDGAERYYELDRGMRAEHFAGLVEGGFRPMPSPMSRTTSIYRAVAKRAVPSYNEDRGDRILVILCPQADWPKLALHWPTLPSSPK